MFTLIKLPIKCCNGSSTLLVFSVQLTSQSSACVVTLAVCLLFFFFFFFIGMGAPRHSACLSRQGTHTPKLSFQAMFSRSSRLESKSTHSCGVLGGASVECFPMIQGEIKAVGLEKHVVYQCFLFPFILCLCVGWCVCLHCECRCWGFLAACYVCVSASSIRI